LLHAVQKDAAFDKWKEQNTVREVATVQDWYLWSFVLGFTKEIDNAGIEIIEGQITWFRIFVRSRWRKVLIGSGRKYQTVGSNWSGWCSLLIWIGCWFMLGSNRRLRLNGRLFAFEREFCLGSRTSEWFDRLF
jgi:hypothetical protein